MPSGQLNKVIAHLHSVLVKEDALGLADGELLKRYVRQRDEAAFEALLRRHHRCRGCDLARLPHLGSGRNEGCGH